MSGFENNHFGTHVVLVVRKYASNFAPPLTPHFNVAGCGLLRIRLLQEWFFFYPGRTLTKHLATVKWGVKGGAHVLRNLFRMAGIQHFD